MNTSQEIIDKINNHSNILLSLHVNPDGDSLGSCVAMKKYLQSQGKKVTIVSPDPLPEMIAHLSYANEVEFRKDIFDVMEGKDLLIALDVPTLDRLSKKDQKVTIPTIRIDHHDTKTDFAEVNFVDPKEPSTCSLLLRIFKETNIDFGADIANPLLLGIVTDTNFFVIGIKINEVFGDVQYLISKGADYNQVLQEVYYNKPLGMKKAVGKLFNNLVMEDNIAYSTVSKEELSELGLNIGDMRIAIKELTGIKGADIVFALVEGEKAIKASLRSQHIDISKAAEELGGGGHSYASGFSREGTLEEAVTQTLAVVKKYL